MVAREPRFGKVPARLVLLAGVLLLVAAALLLAPSGAAATTASKGPDVAVLSVRNDGYYLAKSSSLLVEVKIANLGQKATPVKYRVSVFELAGGLPGLKPIQTKTTVSKAIGPGQRRTDVLKVGGLPLGRATLKVAAIAVGDAKPANNLRNGEDFSVIPASWQGTAKYIGTNPWMGWTITGVGEITFSFYQTRSLSGKVDFEYRPTGHVSESVSGGGALASEEGAGSYTFGKWDLTASSSNQLVLSEDLLVYSAIGSNPYTDGRAAYTTHYTNNSDGSTHPNDRIFKPYLDTGRGTWDKKPSATVLSGATSGNDGSGEGMDLTWTWSLKAQP
jgi:hypothetical protein